MNIDELEAGRELDALVAERVLELPVWRSADDKPGEDYDWLDPIEYPCILVSDYTTRDVPYYSRLIGNAWEVVKKLITASHSFEFYLAQQTDGWDVSFQHPGNRGGQAHGNTAPLAICRAALKAVEDS